jgi:hypothetical protein
LPWVGIGEQSIQGWQGVGWRSFLRRWEGMVHGVFSLSQSAVQWLFWRTGFICNHSTPP